ncbi:hypothetical protein MXD62_01550 [Frankia sp. Mgl5]|uniref:hypothetical protein n=1 Tax=Frankia sp. Mgl5 TaxID=2933793 RepID=UPI00200E6E76|nr:hypothetical protein [Frankia sp. Mgl5]MCK9925855.1 hypothetical protein [Frankia sp. Mgl5]
MGQWEFGLVELATDLDTTAAGEVGSQAEVLIPRSITPERPAHSIFLGAGSPPTLRRDATKTSVRVPDPNAAATAVTVLAASRLAALREAEGVLTFHAAAVATSAGAVLLTGPPMAGKTSVALEMERRLGWRIVSTNVTCVRASTGELTAGTARLTVRGQPGDRFRLVSQGIRLLPSAPVRVVAIADVMPGPSPLWADDHNDAAITVHRHAAEWPRMVTALTGDLVDTGLDIQETAAYRWALVQTLIDRVRCVRLSGPAAEIAEWLGEQAAF